MKKQAEQWLLFSKIDLSTAGKVRNDEFLTRSAVFHCHQSVEKSIKAVLELYDRSVPRTHDLRLLIGAVEKLEITLEYDDFTIDALSQVYIDSRYPSDFGLLPGGVPTVEKAQEFYELANALYRQVEEIVRAFPDTSMG